MLWVNGGTADLPASVIGTVEVDVEDEFTAGSE
jgi:hypothetical protein